MSQLIIPIFITHQGCPHRCSFCNQTPVTGSTEKHSSKPAASDVEKEISLWLSRSVKTPHTQVAFYGGSFTGLPQERQVELLDAVQPFITKGDVHSIRLSTRPDYIEPDTAAFLKDYHVQTVEIGVQSMDQSVLDKNFRGHTVSHVETSIERLKNSGLKVGAQLLPGLPGESTFSAIKSAKKIAALYPDYARIYPALVLKGSALENLYWKGQYNAMSLNQAIALCSRIKSILEKSGISVIRIGLQPSKELADNVISGPYHPALGELVLSRSFFKSMRQQLRSDSTIKHIKASKKDQSILLGQKKSSFYRLQSLGLLDNIDISFLNNLPRGTIEYS